MVDKVEHIAWAAEAVAVFQRHCRTGDRHATADLICDLGHRADERGLDFLSEVGTGTRSIMLVPATSDQMRKWIIINMLLRIESFL